MAENDKRRSAAPKPVYRNSPPLWLGKNPDIKTLYTILRQIVLPYGGKHLHRHRIFDNLRPVLLIGQNDPGIPGPHIVGGVVHREDDMARDQIAGLLLGVAVPGQGVPAASLNSVINVFFP